MLNEQTRPFTVMQLWLRWLVYCQTRTGERPPRTTSICRRTRVSRTWRSRACRGVPKDPSIRWSRGLCRPRPLTGRDEHPNSGRGRRALSTSPTWTQPRLPVPGKDFRTLGKCSKQWNARTPREHRRSYQTDRPEKPTGIASPFTGANDFINTETHQPFYTEIFFTRFFKFIYQIIGWIWLFIECLSWICNFLLCR